MCLLCFIRTHTRFLFLIVQLYLARMLFFSSPSSSFDSPSRSSPTIIGSSLLTNKSGEPLLPLPAVNLTLFSRPFVADAFEKCPVGFCTQHLSMEWVPVRGFALLLPGGLVVALGWCQVKALSAVALCIQRDAFVLDFS